MLTNNTPYTDLGSDYYTRLDNPDTRNDRLVRQFRELGDTVALEPGS